MFWKHNFNVEIVSWTHDFRVRGCLAEFFYFLFLEFHFEIVSPRHDFGKKWKSCFDNTISTWNCAIKTRFVLLKSCNGNTILKKMAILINNIRTLLFYIINIKIILFPKKKISFYVFSPRGLLDYYLFWKWKESSNFQQRW